MKLLLRVFADCESAAVAHDIGSQLGFSLSRFSPEAQIKPRPYWKLPHLFEFAFSLTPATEVSFQAIIAASSGGWSHSGSAGELSSVWNRRQDHVLLVPEVSWAEIQLYEEAP